ncbi:peptidyl-lys metalloendopeptidase, putative, partial [Rhizoctonia solani AG-3 Rhs1AP]
MSLTTTFKICLLAVFLTSVKGSPPLKPFNPSVGIANDAVDDAKTQEEIFSFKDAKAPSGAFTLSKLNYTGCAPDQGEEIVNTIKKAQSHASAARKLLGTYPKGLLYTRWFGKFNPTVYGYALQSSSRLSKLPAQWQYKCQSECPKGRDNTRLSYIRVQQPNIFNVCPDFWLTNSTLDMRVFNLIQEGACFIEVLGASYIEHGRNESMKLAAANPIGAGMNSDNHAFFITSVPGERIQKIKSSL